MEWAGLRPTTEPMTPTQTVDQAELLQSLRDTIERAVAESGGSTAPIKPGHRIPFHWPPHSVSADFHVLPSDWTGRATMVVDGESFDVQVARTPYGVFGRCEQFWNDARGESVEQMLAALAESCRPLFARQRAIARAIGMPGRYEGHIRDLGAPELLALLYCSDRDAASLARVEIESLASSGVFGPALIMILRDDRHPYRRTAQWNVLDMFEDLPSFCRTEAEQADAIQAIRDLIWSAPDDYGRTAYKAGVVLGGEICTDPAADALIACIAAPSRIGRRSAIHAAFHLAEWRPERTAEIVSALRRQSSEDEEPLLREFAGSIADDIEAGATEHMTEPLFAGEG